MPSAEYNSPVTWTELLTTLPSPKSSAPRDYQAIRNARAAVARHEGSEPDEGEGRSEAAY